MTRRISVRAQLAIFAGLMAIFVIAFMFLRPPEGALSDAEYVAMAKSTPQGELFFKKYDAPCQITRVWTVQVNCDYVPAGFTATERFRVHIDPRTNKIIDIEVRFTP
jgi:hypothetical protein